MSLRLALVPGLAAGFAFCATPEKTGFQLGLPGTRLEMSVARVTPRGPYLEALLRAPGLELVSYAPADAACREVLQPEARVTYRFGGTGGVTERAGQHCDAAGIGSLDEWRRRRPRPRTGSPVPSSAASYRQIYQDEQVVLLRGRFPLASLLGWAGSSDSVAVVPNLPVCQAPVRAGSGALQYYPTGREVLVLGSEGGTCPILGLLTPPPG